jgi:hypothetical protein
LLDGQVPEKIVTGQKPDISHHAEYNCYRLVKFKETALNCPEEPELLGCNLGSALDIGYTMACNVLKGAK